MATPAIGIVIEGANRPLRTTPKSACQPGEKDPEQPQGIGLRHRSNAYVVEPKAARVVPVPSDGQRVRTRSGHKECVINVAMGAIVGQVAIKAGVKIIECARIIRQKELNSQNLSCGVGKSLAQEPIGPNGTKDCKMVAGMRFV